MGLIIHKDGYWEYESKNGLTYELLEGKTIGASSCKEYTSDILFILLDTSKAKDPEIYDDKRMVGWFYGATNLAVVDGYLYKETRKTIESYVDKYERENPDIVKELQPPKRDYIIRVTKTGIVKVHGWSLEDAERIAKNLDNDRIFWTVETAEEKED